MKRIAVLAGVVLGMALCASQSQASWSELSYSGYQPWWNIFAKRYKCLTPEEERLQKFWHDYYDAMKNYYKALDHIDWVAYYKNHGYQINGGCGPCGGGGSCGRVNYAPVFVSPTMNWAVPNGSLNGPPVAPCGYGPSYGGGGPPMGMPMQQMAMPGPGAQLPPAGGALAGPGGY
jgi:hypothetical protein